MKKRIVMVLFVVLGCLLLLMGNRAVQGQAPPWDAVYFERCEEVRQNATEYDRCIGDELNKQRAEMAKTDELNLERCTEFLVPYDKMNYQRCVGEEFNKFPEYGPEVMEQYLAGAPWTWPEDDPPWWDDYFPATVPEAAEEGEFDRWWEDGFYITPEASSAPGKSWSGYYSLQSGQSSLPPW